jgi:hypothetical protein
MISKKGKYVYVEDMMFGHVFCTVSSLLERRLGGEAGWGIQLIIKFVPY